MIKLVIAISRRPELSREEFETYWCTEHAALVCRHAEALRLVRYVQSRNLHNELIGQVSAARGWSGEIDGLVEIWWRSEEDMAAAFASAEGQAASVKLAADEATFCDMSSVVAFLSAENVVFDRTAQPIGQRSDT